MVSYLLLFYTLRLISCFPLRLLRCVTVKISYIERIFSQRWALATLIVTFLLTVVTKVFGF